MTHSIIDTVELGSGINRYGPTSARQVSTKPIRVPSLVVDTHSHIMVAEAAEYIAPHHNPGTLPFVRYSSPETRAIQRQQDTDRHIALTDPEDRIAVLDAQGIDIQLIAPAPNQCYYEAAPEHAGPVSRLVNDGVAAFVASFPERLRGIGTVSLQHMSSALSELDYVVDELGMHAVQIQTNVMGMELSDPMFEPFWAKAAERDVVIMLHPLGFTEAQRFQDFYFANVIGNPLDTAVALHHLIMAGVLERHPTLKLFAIHGGGYLPAYSGRIDHAWGCRREANKLPKPPSEYLKSIYFDTTVFTTHQLEYLVKVFGSDHIVMGTDYPFDMAEYYPVEHIDSSSLSKSEKTDVYGATAAKLFRL